MSIERQYGWQLPFIAILAAFGVLAGLLPWLRHDGGQNKAGLSTSAPPPSDPPSPEEAPAAPPRVLPGLVLFSSAGSDVEDLWLAFEDPPSSGRRWLGRLNGATGSVLWKRPVADAPGLGDGLRAWIDGGLLVAGDEHVLALNAETGETLWSRASLGPTRDLCSGDGVAGLVRPNDQVTAFSVSTGADVAHRPGACEPVVTSRSIAPNFSVVEGGKVDPPLPARAPFHGAVASVLVPHQGTARVVLASDRIVAAVAVATRRAWVWSARLGQGRSGTPRFLVPPLAAVRNERVVVPYVLSPRSELRLASFELTSGRLAWDVSLTTEAVSADAPDAELRVSRLGTIYVADGRGRLWATTFDSRPAWSLGER